MATSFQGWGTSWGDSWGAIDSNPGAMYGAGGISFSASGTLRQTDQGGGVVPFYPQPSFYAYSAPAPRARRRIEEDEALLFAVLH